MFYSQWFTRPSAIGRDTIALAPRRRRSRPLLWLDHLLRGRAKERRETAEELPQETFTPSDAHAGSHTSSNDIRPWLYRIATNIAIDQSRHARRFRFIPFVGIEPRRIGTPSRSTSYGASSTRCLRSQSTALVLRLHGGFALVEIAHLLRDQRGRGALPRRSPGSDFLSQLL